MVTSTTTDSVAATAKVACDKVELAGILNSDHWELEFEWFENCVGMVTDGNGFATVL